MLTTFVIGLREGLEASLIVGIIAAFLVRTGGGRALRQMWLGVAAAVVICLAVGVTLALVSAHLPQRQQEALECVIAAVAVGMITYMILWMNSHSRGLKGELESAAANALARGSALALIAMAFLAVLREGFETSVFLLAAFGNAVSPAAAALGVVLGIACAVLLGYLIYRGGTRINLSRFFRLTGAVLVLVAGGLLTSALRAAFEAGWLAVGQQPVLDLSWLVRPGSVQAAMIGGLFGIQAQPVVVEVVAWVIYVGTMLTVVLWPRSRRLTRRQAGRALLGAGAVAASAAGLLVLLVPPPPTVGAGQQSLPTSGTAQLRTAAGTEERASMGTTTVTVRSVDPSTIDAQVTAVASTPLGAATIAAELPLALAGTAEHSVLTTGAFVATPQTVDPGPPESATLTGAEVAELNGGRRPIGLTATDMDADLPVTYLDTWRLTLDYDPASGVVVDARYALERTLQVVNTRGTSVSAGTVLDVATRGTPAAVEQQQALAVSVRAQAQQREIWGQVVPAVLGVAAVVLLAFGASLLLRRGRARPAPVVAVAPAQPADVPAGPAPDTHTERVTTH